uniref:Uncharacterized protein n=1 Tax=Arundo donax TaxID=35708 RepID=A0A0A9EX18_ARUDO
MKVLSGHGATISMVSLATGKRSPFFLVWLSVFRIWVLLKHRRMKHGAPEHGLL